MQEGATLLKGQYIIKRVLGQGGFGITYLAQVSGLERMVAIKECFPTSLCTRTENDVMPLSRATKSDFSGAVDRFLSEARRLSSLSHPSIVRVEQVFQENNTAYMALEYLDGETLDGILDATSEAPPEAEIRNLINCLLDALDEIHRVDMLHRDISPDNIIMQSEGRPVLIDFGAAREAASKVSRAMSSFAVVKDGYSPNEYYVKGSHQGAASDLYALAATVYKAITGEAPEEAPVRSHTIAAQSPDPFVPLMERVTGYSPELLTLIDDALAFRYKHRPEDSKAWRDRLAEQSDPITSLAPAGSYAERMTQADAAAMSGASVASTDVPETAEADTVTPDSDDNEKKKGKLVPSLLLLTLFGAVGAGAFAYLNPEWVKSFTDKPVETQEAIVDQQGADEPTESEKPAAETAVAPPPEKPGPSKAEIAKKKREAKARAERKAAENAKAEKKKAEEERLAQEEADRLAKEDLARKVAEEAALDVQREADRIAEEERLAELARQEIIAQAAAELDYAKAKAKEKAAEAAAAQPVVVPQPASAGPSPEELARLQELADRKADLEKALEEAKWRAEQMAQQSGSNAPAVAAPEPTNVPAAEPKPEPVGPVVTQAKVIKTSSPEYPRTALERGLEGFVEMSFEVGANGVPQNIRITDKAGRVGVFESAAKTALSRVRYDPKTIDGKAVVSETMKKRYDFVLAD